MPQPPRARRSSTRVCRSCCACCIRWSRTRRGCCGTTSGTLRVWVTCSTRAGRPATKARWRRKRWNSCCRSTASCAASSSWPARVEQVTHTRSVPEVVPQYPRRVRDQRIQHAQQDRQTFVDNRRARGGCGVELLERIEHFHRRRDDGVVLDALVVVVGLLEREVDVAPRGQRGPGGVARRLRRCCG